MPILSTLRSGLILFFCGFSGLVSAQNAKLVFSGPIRMVGSGNTYLVLRNTDFINNAAGNTWVPGTGTVVFTGPAAAGVGGSSGSSFYNIDNDKPGTELSLGTTITVSGTLRLLNGNVNLQSATLDLSGTGSLSGETYPAGNRVYCADDAPGRIRTVRIVSTGSNNNIAGLGLDLTVTGSAPGSTVIYRGHDRQTSTAFAGAGTSIGRYYDIQPTVTTGFTYDFLFRYHDQELASMPETGFVFYRSASHGSNSSDWQEWGAGNGVESPGYPTAGLAVHTPGANTVFLAGINTFSRWTVSNSLVTPLPIVLDRFSAICHKEGVSVSWGTVSEINNAFFTVYRSSDLSDWEPLFTLPGAGNSNQPLSYGKDDLRPLPGPAYYRLLQQDYDGTVTWFPPVSVDCGKTPGADLMAVFPNPADERFTVTVFVARAHPSAELRMTDMNGKQVHSRRISLEKGGNEFTFGRTGIAPGLYTLSLSAQSLSLLPVKLILQ